MEVPTESLDMSSWNSSTKRDLDSVGTSEASSSMSAKKLIQFREIILQIKTMDNLFLVQLKIRYININHNIIILISSYPFISLINCPWLLFHGIILLSFYCIFFDCIYFGTSLRPCREDFVLSSLAFLILLTFIYYWIRDVIREAIKKYEVLPAGLFIVFLIFVFSEGMLFLSFFWASFHSSLTDIVEEGLYVPDLCELTYTNTLLLSNAALSLGCAKIHKENNHGNSIDYSFILAWAFITLQI